MSTPENKPQDPSAIPAPDQNDQTPPAEENAPKVEMSEEDEAIVLERLRELGYVD